LYFSRKNISAKESKKIIYVVSYVGSKDGKPIKYASLKDCKLQIQYTVTDLLITKKQTGFHKKQDVRKWI
jgi:hypothetical protein